LYCPPYFALFNKRLTTVNKNIKLLVIKMYLFIKKKLTDDQYNDNIIKNIFSCPEIEKSVKQFWKNTRTNIS